MTVVHHIGYSRRKPEVGLTASGRVKLSFGDTSISLEPQDLDDLVADLDALRARLAVMEDYEARLAD